MNRVVVLLAASVAALHCQSLQLALVGGGTPIHAGNTIQISLSLVGGGGNIAVLEEALIASTGGTVTVANGPADAAAGKHTECAQQAGASLCLDVGLNLNAFADGILHTYSLQIPSNAAAGQATITLAGLVAATPSGTAVPITGSTLTITLAAPLSPCDLDGSGITDITDVNLAVKQALGLAQCTDISSDGKCNAVDVARIIAAALGGVCRSGN